MLVDEVLFRSLEKPLFQFLFMVMTILSGVFDNVKTECGSEFYAENTQLWPQTLTVWFEMPANSLVNIGYVVIGLTWLFGLFDESKETYLKSLNDKDHYYFKVFCWMAIIYGPVQFLRILSQNHRIAVLDQWLTLPFFAWFFIWCLYVSDNKIHSDNLERIILYASVMSYFMALLTDVGFEIVLILHILVALISAFTIQILFGDYESFSQLSKALLCCFGFVALKLLDKQLGYWKMFQLFSGHFWSKVCDFLQIHFACNFFLAINTSKKNIEHKH